MAYYYLWLIVTMKLRRAQVGASIAASLPTKPNMPPPSRAPSWMAVDGFKR